MNSDQSWRSKVGQVSESCVSDRVLDAVVAGEIAVPTHARSCARCRTRLELFRQMQEQLPPRGWSLPVSTRRPGVSWAWWGGLTFATAVFSLAIISSLPGGEIERPFGSTRTKGSALTFFLKRGESVARGESGGIFRTGDALRFRLSLPAPSEVMIVGIEEDQTFSVYYPFDGTKSKRVGSGSTVDLEGSVVLDDTTNTEYLLTIVSPVIVTADVVRAAVSKFPPSDLQHSGDLGLPGDKHWIILHRDGK